MNYKRTISNLRLISLKLAKSAGYERGHFGDPQFEIPDVVYIDIPKNLFYISTSDGDIIEEIEMKENYTNVISTDDDIPVRDVENLKKEFSSSINDAVNKFVKQLEKNKEYFIELYLNDEKLPRKFEENSVSKIKIEVKNGIVDKDKIINWLKKEISNIFDFYLDKVRFKEEDIDEYVRKSKDW